MNDKWDIVVVGGGPAGATAAGLLALKGLKILLCEGKAFPREKVCGEFMGTRMRSVLHRLDLLGEFDRSAGPEVRRVLACAPNGAELMGAMPRDPHGIWPRAMGRAAFDEMLLQRAAQLGTTIHQPCHVNEISGNAHSGFKVNTSDGIMEARLVIIAHGLAQVGDLDPSPYHANHLRRRYVSFKTHLADCELHNDTIAIASGAGIYAGLVHSSDHRFSLAFVARRDRLARYGNTGDRQLHALLAENPGFRRLLHRSRPVGDWMASGPLEPGVRNIYRDGRFFVGNAAGEVHALVGEGITLALHGAAILADTLHKHGLKSLDAAGRDYQANWRREFASRYATANLFANLMMRPALADIAGAVVEAYPEVLDACIRQSGK